MVEPDRPQMTIKCKGKVTPIQAYVALRGGTENMRFARRISEARRQTHCRDILYLLLSTAVRNNL
jgi:hypothetical protein